MKTYDFPAFAKAVHENAVKHGWYDPAPTIVERVALIHCEWSEAVQAWREGVDAYVPTPASFECKQGMLDKCPGVCDDKCPHYHPTTYKFYEIGPRGYAVELIDGVLRIVEWMASVPAAHHELGQIRESWQTMNRGERYDLEHMELPEAVVTLHNKTVRCLDMDVNRWAELRSCVVFACKWLHAHGIEPIPLMEEKHEHNKTRPYRHGGKKC